MRLAITPLSPISMALILAAAAPACSDDGTNGQADTTTATEPDQGGADGTTPDTSTQPEPEPDTPPQPDLTELVMLVEDEEIEILLGASRGFDFEVPANTVSVTITVEGEAGSTYTLNSWEGPFGELVNAGWLNQSQNQGGICMTCDNRITFSQGAFAAIAPNNPDAILESGTHRVSLIGFTPAVVRQDVDAGCGDGVCAFFDQFTCAETDCQSSPYTGPVRVWVHAKVPKDGPELPPTGVLDLNLHFTGAQGLTAASAKLDESFQADLESMRTIYAQAGITLGMITYRDVDERFQVIESMDGPESDLQELFRQSDVNTLNALNLYFVDELSAGQFGGFGVILGIAGGIPGPVLVQGSHRSGVAIAIKPVQGAPAGIDTTMAHEAGHYLGLFHTSEQSFGFGDQLHDPLPDTPQNDETYLMFNTGAGDKLSPWQGQVMRSNPWVRHPIATEL